MDEKRSTAIFTSLQRGVGSERANQEPSLSCPEIPPEISRLCVEGICQPSVTSRVLWSRFSSMSSMMSLHCCIHFFLQSSCWPKISPWHDVQSLLMTLDFQTKTEFSHQTREFGFSFFESPPGDFHLATLPHTPDWWSAAMCPLSTQQCQSSVILTTGFVVTTMTKELYCIYSDCLGQH